MEDFIKDTLNVSPYPFWITILLFAGISTFANYLIVYFQEKARRKIEDETSNIGSCETSITHLCNYLKAYNTRYGENENVQSILQYNRNIERLNEYEDNGESYFDIAQLASEIDAMLSSINHIVAQFLPKFHSAEAQAPT